MPSSATVESNPSRFFIALLPPQEVDNFANQVIQELNHRYQTRTSNAPPHITLQPPFLWQPEKRPELISCIQAVTQTQSAVPVQLLNFGAFAPRVLFIDVVKTPELLSLQAQLMKCLEDTLGIVDPMSKRRTFAPHMTIASRNLSRQTFRQAWSDLQTRRVEFDFVCDRLTLLIHDGHRWQNHTEFPFVKIC